MFKSLKLLKYSQLEKIFKHSSKTWSKMYPWNPKISSLTFESSYQSFHSPHDKRKKIRWTLTQTKSKTFTFNFPRAEFINSRSLTVSTGITWITLRQMLFLSSLLNWIAEVSRAVAILVVIHVLDARKVNFVFPHPTFNYLNYAKCSAHSEKNCKTADWKPKRKEQRVS